jgi:hypothetical protein
MAEPLAVMQARRRLRLDCEKKFALCFLNLSGATERRVDMVLRLWVVLVICVFGSSALGGAATWSRSASAPLTPPTFRASPKWVTLTTGPATSPAILPPQVWAITVRGNVSALRPFSLFNGLRQLSRDAILIWASTSGRGGPTRVFTRAKWPLRLSSFRVDEGWEGQPAPNVQQRLRWASVNDWRLDVRVYFATQHPGIRLLRAAQAELDRLLLPHSR